MKEDNQNYLGFKVTEEICKLTAEILINQDIEKRFKRCLEIGNELKLLILGKIEKLTFTLKKENITKYQGLKALLEQNL